MKKHRNKSIGRVDTAANTEPKRTKLWRQKENEQKENGLPSLMPTISIPFCPLDPEERHTSPRDPVGNFAAWSPR